MKRANETQLRPSLGLFDATAIGVGAIIGGGIFVVTGIVAGVAGPALVVSIIIAGVVAALTALSYVELAEWLPKEGSIYEYARRLVSPFWGFLAGWMWIVSNTFTGAAVSLVFAHYLAILFPLFDVRVSAALLCVGFTILNYVGVKHSAQFNNILVVGKLIVLGVFVAAGLFYINPRNFVPFVPSELGVLYGAFFIFFAFGGFARVTVMAEEVVDARRNVPRSMIIALLISAFVYVLVGIVAVGLVGAQSLGRSDSPLAEAISVVGRPILVYVVALGGMLATGSVLLTSVLGVSRMIFAMARKRDLPLCFGELHQRFGTPHNSVIIAGIAMTVLAVLNDLAGVVGVSTFALLFYYAAANASASRLDQQSRVYPKFVPGIALVSCLLLLPFISGRSLMTAALCLFAGMIYHSRHAWSSREHRTTVRYLLAWLAMPLLGIGNAVIRELTYRRYVSELLAHQISTLTGIILFGFYIWFLNLRWKIQSTSQALSIGLAWLMLTTGFEFLFGHYVMMNPWRKLLQDYNIMEGRVWVLFLIWITIAPLIFCRFLKRPENEKDNTRRKI